MSLYHELKRRNVFRVGIAYLALAWLLTEVSGTLFPAFGIPDWGVRFVVIVFALGFVPALIISCVYEFTPEGIKREKDVVRDASITRLTAKRLDGFTIGLIVVALAFLLADRFWLSPRHAEQIAAPAAVVTDNGQTSKPEPTEPQYPSNSIAVLAFDDLSPDGDQGWFSDGLTEEIINSLAQLPELKVTARISAFHFKGLDLPIPEIAATLGVAHVVEGSVRRAGERMRVTAQLIKADDGFHLWSETYDRGTDDVFAVQEDIAVKIAAALDIYLDEARREKMFQTGTRNVQAYEAYLRGQQLYSEWHTNFGERGLIWESQRWFERALEHDPEFAQAHFDHGDAYLHYANGYDEPPPDADAGLTPETAFELALQDFDRAIEFAHNEELRVLYQAERTLISDDWSGFRSLLDKLGTIRETSTSPIFTQSNQSDTAFALLGRTGIESNYRYCKRRLERNPLDASLYYLAAMSAMGLGEYNEALEFIQQRERFWSTGTESNVWLRNVFAAQTGRYDEFLSIPDTPLRGGKALVLALAGRRDEARSLIEEYLQEEVPANRGKLDYFFLLARALQELGETERAAKLIRVIDTLPGNSPMFLTLLVSDWGGRLTWDLEWTPNFAARLAEMGVELEPYEFPPPAE